MATDGARKPSAFGTLLKHHRVDRGLTQEELAERAGVSARLISDLERGVVLKPRRDTARMLADALDLVAPARERLLETRHESAPRQIDPIVAPVPGGSPGELPSEGLIGRTRELATIATLLTARNARLVTLTGMGGVGKTRLAVEIVRRLRGSMPGDILFIDLTPVRDDALLLSSLAAASDVQIEPDVPVIDALARVLAGREILFVLDNLEHLPAAADVVAEILARVPRARVLGTSREPLRLREEIEVAIEPLPVPPPEADPSAATLAGFPAVELLVRRAAEVRPSFELNDGNAGAVAEIVRGLDGLPLAIELVAVRLRSLTAVDLARRLERRLPLLTTGPRNAPARHQTMAAAIDWSYHLLSASEQLVYRRFAVFDGGAGLAAVEAVCGHGLNPDELLDRLHSLTEKHLVQIIDSGDGETRYRMLETVREHGIGCLVDAGEEAATRARHAAWCLAFARRAKPELTGSEQERWIRAIGRDHDNVRAALRWAIGAGDAATAHGLTAGLIRFWAIRGLLVEARGWFEATLALGDGHPTTEYAEALIGAGVIACFLGDYPEAQRHTERALHVSSAIGDSRGIGSAFGNLGLIADVQGHFDEASRLYNEALTRFREMGDITQAGYMLGNLGMIAHDQGDAVRASELHREALSLWRTLGNTDSMAHSLSSLGQASFALGDYDEATRMQVEALELRETLGNETGIAKCLECLAEIAVATATAERAAWLLGAAHAIREATGAAAHPVDRTAIERITEAARAGAGRRGFTHAWNAGVAAPRETVLTVALDGATVAVNS
ncbi:MAG: tetratricopeptide repeat protein [Thermomicrobiales bacterium]|nr:tetratricopeptide repeat protein [Thermomicrobiales bacterium]